nr:Ribosome binding protein 1 [Hymenolepis microstoma]
MNLSEEVDNLKLHRVKLEGDLSEALKRAEECDKLRDALTSKTALLDKIAQSSEGVSESGLAAANQYFKEQEAKLNEELTGVKQAKFELEKALREMTAERDNLQTNIEEQSKNIEQLKEKCSNLETVVKESRISDKRSKNDMNSRLIGPSLPPWLLEEKKPDPNEIEKLNNTDPATLRTRVIDLEGKVHELKQLVTYREDVILRIYQEIQKKSSKLEASEVERSSLSVQVGILKKELSSLRGSGRRSEGGYPPEIEIEIERLRGKRDREYQRRKRAEAEMDEMEAELNEMKEKVKKMEDELAEIANAPKPVIHAGDPADKARIAELQTVVNQLRLDNESKRSELFDLRSRFEEKSAVLESFSNDVKAKERQIADLSTELANKTSQLELSNKELESVRLRAIRGGVETERWEMDLNSVRTSNRFLSQQTNELRLRLTTTEEQLKEAQKRLSVLRNGGVLGETAALNGHLDSELAKEVADLKSQLESAKETIAKLEAANLEASELKSEYEALSKQFKSFKQSISTNNSTDSKRVSQLLSDLKKEQESSAALAERCSHLTKQLTELENTLNETRQLLNESVSENRRVDLEHAGAQDPPISPPSKRPRRSTRSSSNPSSQDCTSCSELKRQVDSLKSDLAEANTKIESSFSEFQELRTKLSTASEEACKLRLEITSLHEKMAAGNISLKKLRHTAYAFLEDTSDPVLGCIPRQNVVLVPTAKISFWDRMQIALGILGKPVDKGKGHLVGVDKMGNRYFEEEPDKESLVPHRANKPKRYYLLPGQVSPEDSWIQMNAELPRLPSEWDSWLRHRRSDPPTEEELARNAAAAEMRAIKGREFEEKFREELRQRAAKAGEDLSFKSFSPSKDSAPKSSSQNKDGVPFPHHPGLEVGPGEHR